MSVIEYVGSNTNLGSNTHNTRHTYTHTYSNIKSAQTKAIHSVINLKPNFTTLYQLFI